MLVVLWGCGGIDSTEFSGDVNVLLTRGAAYSNYLASRPAQELTDPEVLALGYLERARLGMGSPFRLIDFALNDPDLTEPVRERVAYALLAQVVSGQVYQIDPTVLDAVRLAGARRPTRAGGPQLDLIEREIAAAPSATSGERAVRLGYRLAEAERIVEGVPHSVVAHVAALVADRRRAREDVTSLLRSAAQSGRDPLQLLQQWRRELRFRVERPALNPTTVREEEAEAREGPRVATALRALAHRMSAPTSLVTPVEAEDAEARSVLGEETAAHLRRLAEQRDYPAQAPIAVAVAINRDPLISRPGLEPWQREARARFAEQSWNEERLVAGARLLRAEGAGSGPRLGLIELQAATFLRGWSQEEPWFPGDPAPAARDLEARFGLMAVEVGRDVPERWRPYYLRMLGRSLAELQRVLPTMSLRGLRIHIGELPREVRALALHEPRTRTLFLPPHTGSGTLAHEIAHDLDWQLARSRYAVRGGYATDLAVRNGRGDRIATSLSGLAAALTRPGADSVPNPHETRPAEVFARGTDWLVAALLAREGRTGGYLTSFQDPALTGYGTTRGPDVGGGAVPALFAILDAVAPVVDRTREWALDTYGPSRTLSPRELAGAVLYAGQGLPPEARLQAIARARQEALTSLSEASCRLASAEGVRRLAGAQRELIRASAASAARGAAGEGVRALAVERLGPSAAASADAWLARRLYGAPEPVDSALVDLAPAFEDLLYRAELVAEEAPRARASAFRAAPAPALCGTNPFAAPRVRQPARGLPPARLPARTPTTAGLVPQAPRLAPAGNSTR